MVEQKSNGSKLTQKSKQQMKEVIPGGSIASKNVIPKDLTDEAYDRFTNAIQGGDIDSVSHLVGLQPVIKEPEFQRKAQVNTTGVKLNQELQYNIDAVSKVNQ